MEAKWVREVDYLRGLAILAVLTIHTTANFVKVEQLNYLVAVNVFIDVFSSCAVPLFIFISGFVLSLKYFEGFSLRLFYGKRARSVIPQYLLFSAVYAVYAVVLIKPVTLAAAVSRILSLPVGGVAYGFLTATGYSNLRFFAIIIPLYVFYPAVIRIYRHFNERGRVGTFIALALLAQVSWHTINLMAKTTNRMEPGYSEFDWLADKVYFLGFIFYFALGIYAGRNFESVSDSLKAFGTRGLILASIVLTLAVSFFWLTGLRDYGKFRDILPAYFIVPKIIEPLLYAIVFVLCVRASARMSRTGSAVGSVVHGFGVYSFGIFLIHPLFYPIPQHILGHYAIKPDNLIYYPVFFATVSTISYLSVALISRLPHSELAVGYTQKNIRRQDSTTGRTRLS